MRILVVLAMTNRQSLDILISLHFHKIFQIVGSVRDDRQFLFCRGQSYGGLLDSIRLGLGLCIQIENFSNLGQVIVAIFIG